MTDAVVLTQEQIQQMLAAQQSLSLPQQTASSKRLKTSFKKAQAFQPFYTGGSVVFTPDGETMVSTMLQEAIVVEVKTGNVIKRISGDSEEITCLTISPDGRYLMIASKSLALRYYSLADFELVRSTAKSHIAQVNVMAVDPTSTLLATGGSDGVAKVWDIVGGYCTHVFRGHAGVVSSLYWNVPTTTTSTNESRNSKGKGRKMELVTGSVDGKIRVWDLNAKNAATHKPVATLAGHVSVVRGLAVTDDGQTMVSGARDNTIILWKLQQDVWKRVETLAAKESIESAGFLTRGSQIGKYGGPHLQEIFYTGGSDGQVRLWDSTSRSIIVCEPQSFNDTLAHSDAAKRNATNGETDIEQETRAITAIHYLPRLQTIASVHADQNIVFRSVVASDDNTTSPPPLTRVRQLVGFNDEIVDVCLLSDAANDVREMDGIKESHLAVATNSSAIRVYSLGSNQHSVDLLPGHSDMVLCIDKSPDMRWLASGAKDRTARVWAWVPFSRLPTKHNHLSKDTDLGQKVQRSKDDDSQNSQGEWVCVAVCQGHAESVGAVAFARRPSSPGAIGAPFMVTASQDRTVKLWDLSSVSNLLTQSSHKKLSEPLQLKSLLTLKIHDKDINCLDVSPNNALLASGSQDRTAKLFSISYSPPSKANGNTASAQLKPLTTLKGHKRGVWSVRFSPVDLALVTGSGDRTIRLWSLKHFTCLKIFEGHTNSVLKLLFCSAGMQIVSSAADGLVKIWNVKDEECIDTLDGHEDKVWSIAITRDENHIISAAADSTIQFWQDSTDIDQLLKQKQKQDEILHEQQFSNYITLRDYRNAIALALEMDQPRRLLALFTHVSASRPDNNDHSKVHHRYTDVDKTLENIGILSSGGKKSVQDSNNSRDDDNDNDNQDVTSITGLLAVDQILADLPDHQLIQLFRYIRDWNTSARTSHIAQTVLYSLFSFHSAEKIISLFENREKLRRQQVAQRLEDIENGVVDENDQEEKENDNKKKKKSTHHSTMMKYDLPSLLDGLIPYTERHYQRADRTLIEAAMIEYTLSCMDSVVGDWNDDEEENLELDSMEQDQDQDQKENDFETRLRQHGDAESASESDSE